MADLEQKVHEMEASTFDGVFIWKISDFARKRQEAVAGRTPAIFSPGDALALSPELLLSCASASPPGQSVPCCASLGGGSPPGAGSCSLSLHPTSALAFTVGPPGGAAAPAVSPRQLCQAAGCLFTLCSWVLCGCSVSLGTVQGVGWGKAPAAPAWLPMLLSGPRPRPEVFPVRPVGVLWPGLPSCPSVP